MAGRAHLAWSRLRLKEQEDLTVAGLLVSLLLSRWRTQNT